MAIHYQREVPLVLWPSPKSSGSITPVPAIRDEDRQFALRLGRVLTELRARSGWTRPQAAEAMGLSETSLGRWERGEFAPKGYDLGRLYRGYVPFGAQWEWFFDPPPIVEVNPVKSRLDQLERDGATAADVREARVAERRRQAAEKRAASRGKRPE